MGNLISMIQSAVKDPDAAQAKKLLAEIEVLVGDMACLPEARRQLASAFGEDRDMKAVAQAAHPAPAATALKSSVTPLARSFFPEAFRMVDELRKFAADAKVIAAQVRELPGKV